MTITHLVFDLDDTLYPPGNGLWDEIGERINQYLITHAGVEPAQVNEVRRAYYQQYGTTLGGLMANHANFDTDRYLAYVHDVDPSRYIGPNPALDTMLQSLPQTKVVFTNSDTPHSQRILACLGIQRHFQHIIDIRAMGFKNKPQPEAYAALFRTIEVPASNCVFIEDSVRNLLAAKALGMTTLLVGSNPLLAPLTGDSQPEIDYQVQNILEVGDVLKGLAA